MTKMLEIGSIAKDSKNGFHGYEYTSEAAVTATFRESMAANGLHVKSCEIVSFQQCEIPAKLGSLRMVTVHVRYYFADDDGEQYGPYEAIGSGADSGDKAAMKAMAAARKYALSQAALISWGDDPEADNRTDMATASRSAKPGKHPDKPSNLNDDELLPATKPTGSQPTPGTMPGMESDESELTFVSLLEAAAKRGTKSLESAWGWSSADPAVAKRCRRFAASIDDGIWWDSLKEQAANVTEDTKATLKIADTPTVIECVSEATSIEPSEELIDEFCERSKRLPR